MLRDILERVHWHFFDRSRDERALWSFIQNIYAGESLTESDAKKNVEDGVVEICWVDGGHRANGLLLTRNGYVLTVGHALFEDSRLVDRRKLLLRTVTGEFSLERICAYGHDRNRNDVGLFKADIPEPAEPCRYSFYDFDLSGKQPRHRGYRRELVVFSSRREGKYAVKGGLLVTPPSTDSDEPFLFYCELPGRNGDSGGVILNVGGDVLGLVVGGDPRGVAQGISMYGALHLIDFHRRKPFSTCFMPEDRNNNKAAMNR